MDNEPWREDASLPALLRHARGAYATAMRTALTRAGYDDIPTNGLYIIGGLARGAGGVPIGRLVGALGITKQGAGQLVDTLVTRGYLTRASSGADRRQLIVNLTDRGRAAAVIQTAARLKIDAELLTAVGEADVGAARRALAALIDIGRQSPVDPEGEDGPSAPVTSATGD